MDLTLDQEVRFVKGVGPVRAAEFGKVGVRTVRDLLHYYPRYYAFVKRMSMGDVKFGDYVLIYGVIGVKGGAMTPGVTRIRVDDETGSIWCTWFGRDISHFNDAKEDKPMALWGRVTEWKGKPQLTNPGFTFRKPPANALRGCLTTYPATKRLPSGAIANAIDHVIQSGLLDGPGSVWCSAPDLSGWKESIRHIHQPPTRDHLKRAQTRLKYDELRTMVEGMRDKNRTATGYMTEPMKHSSVMHHQILSEFPFHLTDDQHTAIFDVIGDMSSGQPMYRLLQGDVGCGKTAVAVYASLLAAMNGKQTVVMVPTRILARQHYIQWSEYLKDTDYHVCLLDGSLPAAVRRRALERIAEGKIDVVIATTSVLSDDVVFNRLGLLVVDEQHRFGVDQKDKLVTLYSPNQLYMSATPIPRAVALTAFGDLDISLIKGMPEGRGTRTTRVVLPQEVEDMWDSVASEGAIFGADKVYEVFPRIHGKGGIHEAYLACDHELTRFVHGERKQEDNDRALEQFRDGDIDHLMCTSMVEVGMHVEGADVMVIHEANRFGLSQLHQMRGRIGRGSADSVCYLLVDSDDPEAHDRLRFLETTDDGFEVAQKDLELRGPGEMVGTRQHGMPELKLADLVADYNLLLRVRRDVHGD